MRRATMITTAAMAITACAGPASAGADAPWDAPETLAAGSTAGGRDDAATGVAVNGGHVAVVWRADERTIRAVTRASGAAAFGLPQTLATETAPVRAVAPTVAVGPDARVDAAWGVASTSSADDAVRCATRSGASFVPCASPLFDATLNSNWGVGALRMSSNASGTSALVFEGPGGSAGYDFSRPFASMRTLPAAFATQALDGNIGIIGSGMPNQPRVAVGPDGTAVAIWRLTVTFEYRPVKVAYRAPGAGWAVRPGDESIIAHGNIGPGDYDVAVDGAGDAWVVTRQAIGNSLRVERVGGAYATGSGGTGWGPGQDLAPEGADPQIEVSAAGAATASWTAGGSVWLADRAAGAATTFGAPVALGGGVFDGLNDHHRLLVAPDGTTTVAWIACATDACSTRVVRARTRPAGAAAFGPVQTVRSGIVSARNLQAAADAEGTVALVWQEGNANEVVASVRRAGAGATESVATNQTTTTTTTQATTTIERQEQTTVDHAATPLLRFAVDAGSRLTRAGALVLRVRNTGNRNLRGAVVLRRGSGRRSKRVATGRVTVRAGSARRVTLRLDAVTRRVLSRRGRVVLHASTRLQHGDAAVRAADRFVLYRDGRVEPAR